MYDNCVLNHEAFTKIIFPPFLHCLGNTRESERQLSHCLLICGVFPQMMIPEVLIMATVGRQVQRIKGKNAKVSALYLTFSSCETL